jgi:hypothetical protein
VVDVPALGLLGRDVVEGAEDRARLGQIIGELGGLGQGVPSPGPLFSIDACEPVIKAESSGSAWPQSGQRVRNSEQLVPQFEQAISATQLLVDLGSDSI